MGVNFSQAWVNKSLCKVALSGRKRDYPVFPSPSCQFSSQNAVVHERLPPPPPFGRWTELWRQSWTVARWGEMLAATYRGSERSVLTRRDPGQVALPHPPRFPNKSPLSSPPSLHVHVEVQHQELGFLCAVTAAHRTNEFGIGGTDAPDHAAAASALQCDQVADKLARPKVPQLHRTVIGAGDDKILVELQACYCTLVLVGTWEQNKRNRS